MRLKLQQQFIRATPAYFEALTWAQLGEHGKPCDLLNLAGYYDPLLALFDHITNRGFLSKTHRSMVLVETDPGAMLERFEEYRPPKTAKWIDRSER